MASTDPAAQSVKRGRSTRKKRVSLFGQHSGETGKLEEFEEDKNRPTRWSMGVLNDPLTHEVPGSVILLSGSNRNEPLGLRNIQATTSHSSLPAQFTSTPPGRSVPARRHSEGQKKTKDGGIILIPQPDESVNDPLNWPAWRRDLALLSLGLYCMIGGGLTPILAAGYTNVAATYHTTQPKVALTTGLYMMGMGVGSVILSPTAILYGKRPVYMFGASLLIATSAWCAASPSYNSLLIARIFQGVAVSPVECLPSATIAEIFFLHERAYRIGIYTLLLLGGKNLVPLVSAAIIQSYGWRWVFWIVTMVVGLCLVFLFLFVPETFWDRTPTRTHTRNNPHKSTSMITLFSNRKESQAPKTEMDSIEAKVDLEKNETSHNQGRAYFATDGSAEDSSDLRKIAVKNASVPSGVFKRGNSTHGASRRSLHVGFAPNDDERRLDDTPQEGFLTPATGLTPSQGLSPNASRDEMKQLGSSGDIVNQLNVRSYNPVESTSTSRPSTAKSHSFRTPIAGSVDAGSLPCLAHHEFEGRIQPSGEAPPTPGLHNFNSPFYMGVERSNSDYLDRGRDSSPIGGADGGVSAIATPIRIRSDNLTIPSEPSAAYTAALKESPRKSFVQQLRPWNGRLHHDNWFRVAIRPFILFAYPAVLWSSIVYACSVGWLIVLSESVSTVYRSKQTYNFSALSTGLVYLSPFIGGVLGTGVAGKVSDIIVRAMTRRNGGLYEPEFRLVMAVPIAATTVIGLMGFGWSAQVQDAWIAPTIFFGVISFGCSLGSTTAITFVVDSYRQYAGEALVTLNFSKNIFHGLVFSLFFTSWLEADGSKKVFLAIGGIQLALLTLSIPMYIYGKRARMWTVRMNMMERF